MKTVNINGVTFNAEALAEYETAEEFVKTQGDHYWEGIDAGVRKDRLSTAWQESRKQLKLPTDGKPKATQGATNASATEKGDKGDTGGDKK